MTTGRTKQLTLKQQELIYCSNKCEEYWYLMDNKETRRKLGSKKAERLRIKLGEWEDVIEGMFGLYIG